MCPVSSNCLHVRDTLDILRTLDTETAANTSVLYVEGLCWLATQRAQQDVAMAVGLLDVPHLQPQTAN